MLDVAVAYNRYKFVGDEFLTWFWFIIENDPGHVKHYSQDLSSIQIGNRMVLENRRQKSLETITIKGDDANLEEGLLALRKGAVVTEMSLALKSDSGEWALTIKGESLNVSSFKVPYSAPVETAEEIEGAVLEKVYLYEQALQMIDELFRDFIKKRISTDWQTKIVPAMKKWIFT
jgi:hypothetical protein